jgi:ankyrin repeat protein
MELIEAVRDNNLDLVNQLLLNPQIDVNAIDNDGNTALLIAAEGGYVEIGRRLIESGANVNRGNPRTNFTPLMGAAYTGDKDFVVLLLEQEDIKVNNSIFTLGGETALLIAVIRLIGAAQRHRPMILEIIEILLGSGADPNIISTNGVTALSTTIDDNEVEGAKLLVAHGADVNQRIPGRGNSTALILAVANGYTDMVTYLLSLPNIELDAVVDDGRTALMLAAAGELAVRSIVMRLIEAGADPLVRSPEGKTSRDYSKDRRITEWLQDAEEIWLEATSNANRKLAGKFMVSRRLRVNQTLPVRQLGDGIIQRAEYDQICKGLQSNLTKPGVVALAKSLKIQTTRQTKNQLCSEIAKRLII